MTETLVTCELERTSEDGEGITHCYGEGVSVLRVNGYQVWRCDEHSRDRY